MKGISLKRKTLKVNVSKGLSIYCLQARPRTFQPGNFACWGSEWVKEEGGDDEEEWELRRRFWKEGGKKRKRMLKKEEEEKEGVEEKNHEQ